MEVLKNSRRIDVLKALLLSVTLFLFLFYVSWSIPITILAKAFNILDYFITDNPFVLLSLGISLLLFLLQIIFIFYNQKIYTRIVNASLYFLVITFLYPLILPYNYGGFIDNATLTSTKSLTEFSELYYLLDCILIVFSVFLVKIVVTKKQSMSLLIFFLIFYSVENTIKYSSITLSEVPKGVDPVPVPISENHQNVLLFILDSVSPPFLEVALKNHWSTEEKEWVKDFTYYNNTTGISTGSTMGGIPTLIGGYEFSYQAHINAIISNNIVLKEIDRSKLEYFEDPSYFFSDQAVQSLKQDLVDKADVSYTFLSANNSSPSMVTPIVSVSLYKFIPYFMKGLLAKDMQWKYNFSSKFFHFGDFLGKVQKKSSEKGFIHIIHNDGTHAPVAPAVGYSTFEENPEGAVSQKLAHATKTLRSVIKQLQDLDLYDNTKIIVASDHGQFDTYRDYVKEMASEKIKPWYSPKLPLIPMLPSLLMVKDFNTVNDKMKIDSRFLSLADVPGIMKSTFLSNCVDYTKKNPPNRIFNVPLAIAYDLDNLMGNDSLQGQYPPLIIDGKVVIVQVESITEGLFNTDNTYSFSNIIDIPVYTLVP